MLLQSLKNAFLLLVANSLVETPFKAIATNHLIVWKANNRRKNRCIEKRMDLWIINLTFERKQLNFNDFFYKISLNSISPLETFLFLMTLVFQHICAYQFPLQRKYWKVKLAPPWLMLYFLVHWSDSWMNNKSNYSDDNLFEYQDQSVFNYIVLWLGFQHLWGKQSRFENVHNQHSVSSHWIRLETLTMRTKVNFYLVRLQNCFAEWRFWEF